MTFCNFMALSYHAVGCDVCVCSLPYKSLQSLFIILTTYIALENMTIDGVSQYELRNVVFHDNVVVDSLSKVYLCFIVLEW